MREASPSCALRTDTPEELSSQLTREQKFTALLAAADAARDRQDWPSAAEQYELTLAFQPDANFVRVQFAHALKECGRLAEAETVYQQAATAAPADDDVLLHLGHVRKLMGRLREAVEAYQASLWLNPSNADARCELRNLGIPLGGQGAVSVAGSDIAEGFRKIPERYRFRFDGVRHGRLRGWVVDTADLTRPVTLELVHAGSSIVTFLADGPRGDLFDQLGSSLHGFDIQLPIRFADGVQRIFDIRVASDGTSLVESVVVEHRRLGTRSPLHELQRSIETLRRQITALQSQLAELIASNGVGLDEYGLIANHFTLLDATERSALAALADEHGYTLQVIRLRQDEPAATLRGRMESGAEEVVILLAETAELSADALCIIAAVFAAASDTVLLYGDHDSRHADDIASMPAFKPDFDPLLLLHQDYIGPVIAVRRDALLAAMEFEAELASDTLRKIALRLAARHPSHSFVHVPRILGHNTGGDDLRRSEPPAAWEKVVKDLGVNAAAFCECDATGSSRLRFLPKTTEFVSIIITSKDQSALLAQCVLSLLDRTSGIDYEIILVDHASGEGTFRRLRELLGQHPQIRIIDAVGSFNWARLNNDAVAAATGRKLLFLNNDTMAIHDDWLARMVGYLGFPDVAAVGPKLLYADGRTQHGGVILGQDGGAGHAFLGLDGDDPGYGGFASCAREVSAVTGAALLVDRAAFEAVGGFDAAAFPIGFNDVDFCLRLRRNGRRVVYAGDVRLFHLESQSRGNDLAFAKAERHHRELWALQTRWDLNNDPFYNRNFDRFAPPYTRLQPPGPIYEWLETLRKRRHAHQPE